MADEDFDMMISSSAAASSSTIPAPLPIPNSSAKELRDEASSAMRTESEEFAEKRESDPKDLSSHWKKTKTTGKGVELLGKKCSKF